MIAASLSHPGLVTVLGIDDDGDKTLVVMEWIDGLSINKFVIQNTLELRAIIHLFTEILSAVQHAHSKGVMHGDLKPGNILIDCEGNPHVIDFGIASQLQREAGDRDVHLCAGTIPYAAPEICNAKANAPDARMDVFSLGMILGRLLSDKCVPGTAVVDSDTSGEMPEKAQYSLNSHGVCRSPELEAIISRSTDDEPENRYASVEAFKEDLNRWLDRKPVAAFGTSRTYVAWKAISRHRFMTAISIAAIAGLVALSVLSTVFGIRAHKQRLLSQAAEQRAIEQSALARNVEEFISLTFTAASPELLGRDATIEAAVDYARSQIRLVEDIGVRARLEYVFGDVLFELGRYDAAHNHFSRSVQLQDQITGRDIETHLAARSSLAVTIRHNGDPVRAVKLLVGVAEESAAELGRDHPLTLEIRGNLAAAMLFAGELEQAHDCASQALEDSLAVFGSAHKVSLVLSNTLASVIAKQGDYDRAQELYQQCYELRREHLGRTHPATLVALNNLATSYASAGYLDRAEPLYERAFTLRSELLGEGHPATLRAMRHYADIIAKRNRTSDAIQLLERCAEIGLRDLGSDHPESLYTQNLLGLSLFRAGRFQEAIEVHESCLAAREQILGDEDPETQTSRTNLAIALSRAGEHKRAIELMELAYTHRLRDLGPDHPTTLTLMGNLAMTYSGSDQLDRAEELLTGVLAGRIKLSGSDHPRTAVAAVQLGSVLRNQGRHTDAIEHFQSALPILRQHQGIAARSTLICVERLAISLDMVGRVSDAIKLIDEYIADFDSTGFADRSRIENLIQIRNRLAPK